MAKTVRDYLNGRSTVWNGIPATVAAMGDLATLLSAVDELTLRQENSTRGITADKADLRDDLEGQILLISDGIMAMVAVSGNNALAAGVETTPSALDQASEQKLIDIATRVHGAGTENATALADYGITAAELEELDQKRAAFAGAKTSPQVAIADRAAATATLPELIRDVMGLLNSRLDKLMTRYRTANPEFFAGYQSARVIVDRRGPGTPEPVAPMPSA